MKPGIVWTLIIAVVLIAVLALWLYNKPHRTADQKPFVSLSATELFKTFESDEASANENYLDKVLEVYGEVIEITQDIDNHTIVVLKSNDPIFGVRCTLDKGNSHISIGETIHLKGICKGYLSDVVLTNCIPVKS
jgi:hypothetical protein